MASIVKTAEELIKDKDQFITIDEIIEQLGKTGEKKKDLTARIYTDLLSDGRFFFKDDKVNLTENFIMKEINQIKSSYSMEKLLKEENKLEEETQNLRALLIETSELEREVDVKDLIQDDLTLFGIDDD